MRVRVDTTKMHESRPPSHTSTPITRNASVDVTHFRVVYLQQKRSHVTHFRVVCLQQKMSLVFSLTHHTDKKIFLFIIKDL